MQALEACCADIGDVLLQTQINVCQYVWFFPVFFSGKDGAYQSLVTIIRSSSVRGVWSTDADNELCNRWWRWDNGGCEIGDLVATAQWSSAKNVEITKQSKDHSPVLAGYLCASTRFWLFAHIREYRVAVSLNYIMHTIATLVLQAVLPASLSAPASPTYFDMTGFTK